MQPAWDAAALLLCVPASLLHALWHTPVLIAPADK
jgi:hypothetical protein